MASIEHGLARTLYDFVAMQYIGKRLYPEAFADVEPLQKSLLEDLRAGAEAMDFVPPAPAEAAAPVPEAAADLAGMDFRQDAVFQARHGALAASVAKPMRSATPGSAASARKPPA